MDLENPYCISLLQYFKLNNTYHFEEKFYQTEDGSKLRAEWGRFLNDSKLFNFRKEGKY